MTHYASPLAFSLALLDGWLRLAVSVSLAVVLLFRSVRFQNASSSNSTDELLLHSLGDYCRLFEIGLTVRLSLVFRTDTGNLGVLDGWFLATFLLAFRNVGSLLKSRHGLPFIFGDTS